MDLNFGANQNVTPYSFQMPTGLNVSDPSQQYGALNTFGMPSPTSGGAAGDFVPGGMGANAGWGGIQGLGANLDTLRLGLGGISSLAGLYTGLKSLGLAQDQFNLSKQMATTNLANQTKTYNTALTDRATSRGVQNGTSSADTAAYIAANRLGG